MINQTSMALKRFELENNIEDEKIYQKSEDDLRKLIFDGLPAN